MGRTREENLVTCGSSDCQYAEHLCVKRDSSWTVFVWEPSHEGAWERKRAWVRGTAGAKPARGGCVRSGRPCR